MKKATRWSPAVLLALALFPAVSFARPIQAASHSRSSVVRDRSPRIQSHESILHHS